MLTRVTSMQASGELLRNLQSGVSGTTEKWPDLGGTGGYWGGGI